MPGDVMGFWKQLLSRWRKKEQPKETRPEEKKSFYLYIVRIPQILTWFRREKGIPKKKLELTLIDDEDRPAWQIAQIAGLVMTDLNLLYIVTNREEVFQELAEEAMEESGLLVALRPWADAGNPPGNLVLDIREWEKHLDIMS